MSIIQTVEGDLLDMFEEGHFWGIAHGCNCFNTMGSGIAAQIAKRFPGARDVDLRTVKGDRNKLGQYTVYQAHANPTRLIFNMYTQYTYWDVSDMLKLDAVKTCFETLNASAYWAKDTGLTFGIPKIGAGLAMGDWEEISAIINEATPNMDIVLVEWKPKVVGDNGEPNAQKANFNPSIFQELAQDTRHKYRV